MALTGHSKNIFYLFFGDIASRMLGFIATAYLARVLGISGFGAINLGMSILVYTLIFGDFGLSLLGTKTVAGKTDHLEKFTGKILITRLSLVTIAYIFMSVIVKVLFVSEEIANVILVYQLFLFSAALLLEWFFQGQQRMETIAWGRLVGMLFYLTFVLMFVNHRQDLIMTAWGWVAGGLANTIFILLIFRNSGYRIQFEWRSIKMFSLLKQALPLGLVTLISQVVIHFPVIYLGWFATTGEVGKFSAAFKIVVLLLIFDRVFYTTFYPAITRCAQQTPERLEKIINRILKIVVVSALSIGLGTILSADFIIEVVFGSQFKEVPPILQGMVGYFILTLINSVPVYTLIGMNHERAVIRSLLLGLMVFFLVVLLLFLVPASFSIIGMVGAIILNQLSILIALLWQLRRYIALDFNRTIVLPFCGTFLFSLPLLQATNIVLPLKLVIMAILCLPVLAWLSGIRREDIEFIRKVLI